MLLICASLCSYMIWMLFSCCALLICKLSCTQKVRSDCTYFFFSKSYPFQLSGHTVLVHSPPWRQPSHNNKQSYVNTKEMGCLCFQYCVVYLFLVQEPNELFLVLCQFFCVIQMLICDVGTHFLISQVLLML